MNRDEVRKIAAEIAANARIPMGENGFFKVDTIQANLAKVIVALCDQLDEQDKKIEELNKVVVKLDDDLYFLNRGIKRKEK